MSTIRMSILNDPNFDAGVFRTPASTQITPATAPSVGNVLVTVLNDGGADEGVYAQFFIPKNYVGNPKIVFKGILDGAPGAADVLGFGFRKRAVANNEVADGTFDAEQTVSATIGSNGLGYSDEDLLEMSVTLTAGDYAVDDDVYYYAYIDASTTTYTGNFLVTDIELEYTD